MLQILVFLTNPKKAGAGALISLVISALSTGFTSAKISVDKDVDVECRKYQPKFYGELFPVLVVVVIVVIVANISSLKLALHCMQATSLTITR